MLMTTKSNEMQSTNQTAESNDRLRKCHLGRPRQKKEADQVKEVEEGRVKSTC